MNSRTVPKFNFGDLFTSSQPCGYAPIVRPFVEAVFHPTDFSEASQVAFAHALAIALYRKARLTLLHVAPDLAEDDWRRFPPVRATLERWGLLEEGSSQADVFRKLAVKVKKVTVERRDPADAILDYLVENPSDLMVLATEPKQGLPVFLQGSVARKVARVSGVQTLFVPEGRRGFVAPEDGTLSLQRILVPVDRTPDPGPALEVAARAAEALGVAPVAIHVLHVGEALPELALPAGSGWTWERSLRSGDPVDEILAAARALPADLVVMPTDGRDGLLDVLRGSHSERVLSGAPCPLLTIPVD